MKVFYVESPFQLIQVYEAILFYRIKPDEYKLIIRQNDSKNNNSQIIAVIDVLGLQNEQFIYAGKSFISKIKVVFYILKLVKKTDRVFIGDEFGIVFRILKKILNSKQIVLLDDGVATLKSITRSEFNRFSIFKNASQPNIEQNTFSSLAAKISSDNSGEKVSLVIGSKLVEVGICTKVTYIELLQKMISLLGESNILYIPHRDESEENISFYEKAFSFEVYRNVLPIELIGLELKADLNQVVSTISTALFTMPLIYKDAEFFSVRLLDDQIQNRKAAVLNIYDEIQKNHDICLFKLEKL